MPQITGLQRRQLLRLAAGAAAVPTFAIRTAAADEPVKIGMVIAKQGPFAGQGGDLAKGAMLAFEQAGSKVIGRPAEVVWLDEPNPQGAVQSINKLIEQDKVIGVLGGTSSATSLAMGFEAQRAKVPFISVNGAAREITGKECNPFMFRSPAAVPVYAQAMAPQMLAIGKKWYFIAGAFAFGEDVITTFSDVLKANGGEVVGIDRTPVATTDYSSFVLKARAAKPDVVISGAPNVEPLLKQFKELGLTGNIAIAGPAVSDTDLWSASPDALAGIFGKTWYYNDPNNPPEDKAFVRSFIAKEGKPPSDRIYFGWLSMKLLLAAAQKANSSDPLKVTQALVEVSLPDGATTTQYRKGDHQLLHRLVVATAHKPNPSDKWDVLDIKSSTVANQAALESMYGDPVQQGCKMPPIA